jgi:hypothetical protein
MNCQYCKRPCRKVQGRKYDQRRSYWQCDYHGQIQTRFFNETWDPNMSYSETILICFHKDVSYDAIFYHGITAHNKEFALFKSPTEYGPQQVVLTMDKAPNITPDNFLTKLPTLLTFA